MAVLDPAVCALRERVVAIVQPGIREDEARVRLHLRDGRVFERHVEHALGSLARPMSDRDIELKFRDLAQGVLPAPRIDEALAACWGVEARADAGRIGLLLAG